MRILLTGKDGQLGRCFENYIAATDHQLFAYNSRELDITNADQVASVVREVNPNVIVNAAAFTAVDKAESDPQQAYAVNEVGVRHLGQEASHLGIPLLHVSTDYVFDGQGVKPYEPTDRTSPQSVYGASKRAGEMALEDVCPQHVILRTAWVFSEYGNNFVKTMLRVGQERDALNIVADQYGCPTYAGDLAQALLTLCNKIDQGESLPWGVYHFCGDVPTSWHGFARVIFALALEKGLLNKAPTLTAISTALYPTPAKRPEYSVLSCETLQCLGLDCSHWYLGLGSTLDALKRG